MDILGGLGKKPHTYSTHVCFPAASPSVCGHSSLIIPASVNSAKTRMENMMVHTSSWVNGEAMEPESPPPRLCVHSNDTEISSAAQRWGPTITLIRVKHLPAVSRGRISRSQSGCTLCLAFLFFPSFLWRCCKGCEELWHQKVSSLSGIVLTLNYLWGAVTHCDDVLKRTIELKAEFSLNAGSFENLKAKVKSVCLSFFFCSFKV